MGILAFQSILYEKLAWKSEEKHVEPDFFADLNLDKIINAITHGKDDYDLKPLYYEPVAKVNDVLYRQEVMKELERRDVMDATMSFSGAMQKIRNNLRFNDRLYYKYNKEGNLLDTAEMYCSAVSAYAAFLSSVKLDSRGFRSLSEYLSNYVKSEGFISLRNRTAGMRTELSDIRFSMLIKEGQIVVKMEESDDDYSNDVLMAFEKFKQGAVKNYKAKYFDHAGMNHVEAEIVNLVSRLFPETFAHLDAYCAGVSGFMDDTLVRFDREIQFYIAYLQYISLFRAAGFHFCYPVVTENDKNVLGVEAYDMALGAKLIGEKKQLVCNDFSLGGSERIIVVTGPNQGGKTTFARTFGQLHYLANLGCCVPGREGKLLLFDRLFTHFEKEEDISNLQGNLESDLEGMHAILEQASSRSIVIINEMFSATTVHDGVLLGRKILRKIADMDALCVYVTFLDELASLDKTVSMVSTVDAGNPEIRTFKILRQQADGISHALAIARKHGLTYDVLRGRLKH